MRTTKVPARLALAVSALFLCVPLAAVETVVAARAPWWRLPHKSILLWSSSVGLMCLFVAWPLLLGRYWAFRLLAVFGAIWCTLSAWFALRTHNSALGFFTLLVTWFFGGVLLWLYRELGRSYFDSRLAWYQGLPKPIPHLKCHLVCGDSKGEFRVSRLDHEGAFVFSKDAGEIKFRPGHSCEMRLSFRSPGADRNVNCRGLVTRVLDRVDNAIGAGVQFRGMSSDSRKELGDFVHGLREAGYV